MSQLRSIITTLAIGLAVAACGSDSSSDATSNTDSRDAETIALEASIADALDAIDEEGAISFTDTQATCLAERVVAAIGADRLLELGADTGVDLTGLAWTDSERAVVFEDLRLCVDLIEQLAVFFAHDPAVTDEMATCIATSYADSEAFPDALFATEPDPDLDARVDAALSAAFQECS